MEQKVAILIDGSNFFYKLKDLKLHELLEFDFRKFAKFLAGSSKIVLSNYYVGKVKQDGTKKADKMVANQQKLFNRLNRQKFRYVLGYILKSDGTYHEKGVDVQIAIDIVVAAYENKCDKIILVSSDTDLIPAIQNAQRKGKIVEYVGFKHLFSKAMITCCKTHQLLSKEEIEQFIDKN